MEGEADFGGPGDRHVVGECTEAIARTCKSAGCRTDTACMSALSRIAPEVSIPGEDAQQVKCKRARPGEPLTWQRELDVAIADIDSRLSHPRRRATDVQPTLPQLGQAEITSETIDEIAWRVSELLRKDGGTPYRADAVAAAITQSVAARDAWRKPAATLPSASGCRTASPSRFAFAGRSSAGPSAAGARRR